MLDLQDRPAPTDRPPLAEGYLDPTVKLEALVDRWYAWPHLLSPPQQALNLAFRYLPIVQSFLAAPAVHMAASQDPTMFGGPFLDLPATAVGPLRAYLADLEQRRAAALGFARSFREFDLVVQAAGGFSLDELREQAPGALRGRVELAYDLNSHPKIRLLEEMFEDDDMGHRQAQEVLLHRQPDAERPFFLSTPRVEAPGGLYLRSELGAPAIQELCAARRTAVDIAGLAQRLGAPASALAAYFTADPGRQGETYGGEGVRLRYFGHACVLIETVETTILVDPTAATERHGETHLTLDDLPPRIDVLFISHGHQDHFSPETLMQIRDRVGVTLIPPSNRGEPSDPSLRRLLRCLGFERIVTLEPLEAYDLPDGRITALPFSGEHCDLDVHAKQCAMVELRGRRICLFVDTDAIDLDIYKRLANRLAEPDVMLVGMECFGAPLSWMYGPLLSTAISNRNDTSRRLSGANCARAWGLTETLRPKQVGVYAMGQEPWMRHLMGLNYTEDSVQLRESSDYVARCRAAEIPAERLYLQRDIEL